MDRLGRLQEDASHLRDSTLDTSSPPSESFMTANESSSKYFSLSEVDSTFDISPIKDVSLASTASDAEKTITDSEQLISNLSPIDKKNDLLSTYKIDKQIEAANILSGGVNIFDDNENSYDGDELVIDDNVVTGDIDDKSNTQSSVVSYQKSEESLTDATLVDTDTETAIPSKDTEVVLQIDGKNVDAIDIGNGLYLYRKEGQEELAAVQIIDDDHQQPSFKFLKVRENAEGNLEVYEEIEIEVPKEVPPHDGKVEEKNTTHVPIKDINKVISDPISNKVAERKIKSPQKEILNTASTVKQESEANKDSQSDCKSEININGKMMKFSESRKSPLIGTFTPMAYHSTPNKEGIPLTKTMVDLQLHPSRHSDNVKKTIEVHTDISKQKFTDVPKNKDLTNENKVHEEINHTNQEKLDKDIETSENVYEERNIKEIDKKATSKSATTDVDNTEVKCIKENVGEISLENINQKENEDDINHATNNNAKDNLTSCVDKEPTVEKQKVERTDSNSQENVKTKIEEAAQLNNTPKTQAKDRNENKAPEEATNLGDKISVNIDTGRNDIGMELSEANSKKVEEIDICSLLPNIESVAETECQKDTNIKSTEGSKKLTETWNETTVTTDTTTEGEQLTVEEIPKVDTKTTEMTESNSQDNKQKIFEIVKNSELKKESISKEIEKPKESKTESKPVMLQSTTQNVTDKIDKEPYAQIVTLDKSEVKEKKESPKASDVDIKTNNHAAVPFGKWTEANRQEFLNKIKESKVPSSCNTNQIKQPNDLNRRDVLKKIDSQRQYNNATAKAQELSVLHKLNVKSETSAFQQQQYKNESSTFVSKSTSDNKTKIPVKVEAGLKKQILPKRPLKQESTHTHIESLHVTNAVSTAKKESVERKEINNQDLIDKTIEGLINRERPTKISHDEVKHNITKDKIGNQKVTQSDELISQSKNNQRVTLDDIETKMNELHGIPFIERPPHELPQISHNNDNNKLSKNENLKSTANKVTKIPNLLPLTNKGQQKSVKDNIADVDSEEEIIEHEPVTGDTDTIVTTIEPKLPNKDKVLSTSKNVSTYIDTTKKEPIITEKDFDKFARRNSISYENCLTVNFDNKEPHNVVKTVKEKDNTLKQYSRNESLFTETKAKVSHNHTISQNAQLNKVQTAPKSMSLNDDAFNKNYHSKLQIAYQSALTAKRQVECPITIIEDKPVKVVFVDSNTDFIPSQLNVVGQGLLPTKKLIEPDNLTVSTCDSLDSDILDIMEDIKSHDETKTKTKHQRKQVLTPVETPELELIEPADLGIEVTPKKKRKVEDYKSDKNSKTVVPKKSYLLGRSPTIDDNHTKMQDAVKNPLKESININDCNSNMGSKDTVSAIDSLVKAAELIETQSENLSTSVAKLDNSNDQQNSPVKRGRGRPRKYPLPEGITDNKNKVSGLQKKPRLEEANVTKRDTSSEEDSSDEELIKENWTMGKINENIVCPICNKLFRSENVVFKHVKHCTGPSPSRSDSDRRRSRRSRQSDESETLSRDGKSDIDLNVRNSKNAKSTSTKRKSKDSISTTFTADNIDVVVIEDTPLKDKTKINEGKNREFKKTITKSKIQLQTNNLVCEFCGKTFRQLSYLVNHKLQHKKEKIKKTENPTISTSKTVFSCEVCRKEFRKLHHLVQHRIIHNPTPSKLLRKCSFEQNDNKITSNQDSSKQSEDQSAGFRCERCDKSFRKLHHLVEHRETHDGINRQKIISTTQTNVENTISAHQCDICKKTFRKSHHLVEHKEQHLDTSSEKSDDKSVKSSLSTKDIIHECSLCYMVFPNEHSLTKHTIICQRKKRQSAAKQAKQAEQNQTTAESSENDTTKDKENSVKDESLSIVEEKLDVDQIDKEQQKINKIISQKLEENDTAALESSKPQNEEKVTPIEPQKLEKKAEESDKSEIKNDEITLSKIPAQIKKLEQENKVKDTPKKRVPSKFAESVIKRRRTANLPLTIVSGMKSGVESSDDDEVRYMFNPDFKVNEKEKLNEKLFMNVKAIKRNSLQFERTNSRDSVKRKSLHNQLKIPRFKPKPAEIKTAPTNASTLSKTVTKVPKFESVPSTDSDDSDVKYSFPKTIPKKSTKASQETLTKESQNKSQKNFLTEKRKSLTGIAKRKSLGKTVQVTHKVKAVPVPPVKKRTNMVEHRCDCGQLFSSAAMLSRHTTLAHTPPRIRRRRSPPLEQDPKTVAKPKRKRSSAAPKPNIETRKSSVKCDVSVTAAKQKSETPSRKSTVNKSELKTNSDTRKSAKNDNSDPTKVDRSTGRLRKHSAHRGVPVPEKMRKIAEKIK